MTDRELMQQALEALEYINKYSLSPHNICIPGEIDTAMDALRERLAKPEHEPVAWKIEEVYKDGVLVERRMKRGPDCGWEPLLTPPRREWVGLTDEEKLHLEIMGGKSDVMLAEAIEAKLKEKNACN